MPGVVSHSHAILLRLSYDGASFSGCALQSNAPTIAGVLHHALCQMDPTCGRLRVASRTDAGVHALEQYVACDTSARISSRGWLLGLTGLLLPQIAVTRVSRVERGFNPSREAVLKVYRYVIVQGTIRDPFLEGRSWRVFQSLDLELMREQAETLIGTHDFRAFRSSNDRRQDTRRRIRRIQLEPSEGVSPLLTIEVEGDRFLHNMVRIIVGTLVDIGRGQRVPGAFSRALSSGLRTDLGMTAPASGLYLARLFLRTDGEEHWPYQ